MGGDITYLLEAAFWAKYERLFISIAFFILFFDLKKAPESASD